MLDIPNTVPLGVLDNYKFSTVQASLSGSCSLLMYTDGIIEAGAPNGVQFGPQRLLTAFNCGPGLWAQEIAEHLLSQVLKFSQGELKDDAALLVLRGKPDPAKKQLLF